MLEKFLESYAQMLLMNHNDAKEVVQRNLVTKDDYLNILRPVVDLIKENKDDSLDELREKLYLQSDVDEILKDAIYNRKMAPGAVVTYGTSNYKNVISLGKTSDFEDSISTDENTIYDLASVTKLFTSLSIQLLDEMNQINLNDKITDYLPWLPGLGDTTINELLTFNKPVKTNGRIDKANNKEEAFEIFKSIEVDYENDGKRPYTDMGAMVLKYIVEKVSGMSFYDFVRKYILKKANMDNTFVSIPEEKLNNLALTGYDGFYYKDGNYRINNSVQKGDCYDAKARIMGQKNGDLSGHAGLFSTADNMSNLAIALINREIITNEDLLHMGDNKTGVNGKSIQYLGKLCYSKNPVQEDSEIYHPLSGRAFASAGWTGTQLTVDPDNNIFYSLLSNRSNNRMTFIDADKKSLVFTGKNSEKLITLPNGKTMIDATRYAWDRDSLLVHPIIKLAIQNKFLEDCMKQYNENISKSYQKRHI